jgi:rhodanese-related sulfurtransferase
VLVDVRAPNEWAAERIDGAINVPLSQLRDLLDELPGDRAIVVYCSSGYRSAVAASLLAGAGFAGATDLVGGLDAWKSAQLATVT